MLNYSQGYKQVDTTMVWSVDSGAVFHVAHASMLLGYLLPDTPRGAFALRAFLATGYLMLTFWAWTSLCASDLFSWTFAFFVINIIQVFLLLYKIRPVKFPLEIEDVYISTFKPMNVSRQLFKKLAAAECCSLGTLHENEAYAREEVTPISKLTLLIKGSAYVYRSGQRLHKICEGQFLDSPEYQANSKSEERFHVTILGASAGRCMTWERRNLEHLLSKEPQLATVMHHVLSRDIVDKLYQLTPKAGDNAVDIRLPRPSECPLSSMAEFNAKGRNHCLLDDSLG